MSGRLSVSGIPLNISAELKNTCCQFSHPLLFLLHPPFASSSTANPSISVFPEAVNATAFEKEFATLPPPSYSLDGCTKIIMTTEVGMKVNAEDGPVGLISPRPGSKFDTLERETEILPTTRCNHDVRIV